MSQTKEAANVVMTSLALQLFVLVATGNGGSADETP
jgi:hypothetical protein